ncbi:hypothetical protein BC940DRAFT_177621 [Gongronella butleri]|nr:hypothetical protein BC940DRAFT_177621 [Gongronella butleri]
MARRFPRWQQHVMSARSRSKDIESNLSTPYGTLGNSATPKSTQLVLDGASDAEAARICKTSYATVKMVKFINECPGEIPSYSKNTLENIQKRLLTGESHEKITADYQVTNFFVYMVKTSLGIHNREIGDDKIDQVLQCVVRGMSACKTAKVCRMCPKTVRKICRAPNIPLLQPNHITLATKEKNEKTP